MAQMNANNTLAMAVVTASAHGAGVIPTFAASSGFNTAGQSLHSATGVYVLELDADACCTQNEVCVVVTPTTGTTPTYLASISQSATPKPVPGSASQTYLPTLLTITTFDGAPLAAVDTVSFSVAVFRFPQNSTN